MTMARPLVRSSSLKAYLKENAFLHQSTPPVVVFSSGASRQKVQGVTDFVSNVEGLIQSNGVDVVSASISSIFPTHKDVQDAQQHVTSTGATTVVAVGSGVAMDLVKALEVENKVLLPGTSGAVFAASSPYSLLLDAEFGILETRKSSSNFTSVAEQGTIVPNPDAVTACHSILLDACYRVPQHIPDLELAKWALALDPLVQGMISTSPHMATGETASGDLENKKKRSNMLSSSIRSAPLALATFLVPAFFPRASIFSFWASLLPGLASLHKRQIGRDRFPHLADLAQEPVSVDTLMGSVQRSQLHTSSPVTDLAMEELEQVLSVSLMKP